MHPSGPAECDAPGCHRPMQARDCVDMAARENCCLIDNGASSSQAALVRESASLDVTPEMASPVEALLLPPVTLTRVSFARAFFELPRAPIFLLTESFLI